MSNPIAWLPKPGQAMKIPGGALWCDRWEVMSGGRYHRHEGTITFRVECDSAEYEAAMAEPSALPAPPLALPEG